MPITAAAPTNSHARLPVSVAVVSHNVWLIPFGGAWQLGRTERCVDALVTAASELQAQTGSGTTLVIVAVQEAWAFRVGIFWPALWCASRFEALLLRHRLVSGCREPTWYKVMRSALLLTIAAMTFVVQAWVPFLRGKLWNPKPRIASALKHRASLRWESDSAHAFRSLPPWSWPHCLMDSGLHLSASAPADASGFVAFARAGSNESMALKGVQWARWGDLAVLNTHFVFDPNEGSERRRMQREALAQLVGVLLGLEGQRGTELLYDVRCGLSGVPASSRTCHAVLITGDFNHALRAQCTSGAPGSLPTGPSPSMFTKAWLPEDAALDYLLDALAQGGAAQVRATSPHICVCCSPRQTYSYQPPHAHAYAHAFCTCLLLSHAHAYAHASPDLLVPTPACTCICTRTRTCTCTYTYTCTCTCACACACACACLLPRSALP